MRRVLFAIHYLELGGAEMSLIGLLGALDEAEYDVDLFVYSHRGELMEAIPPQVHLLPEILEYAQIERPMKEVLRDGYLRLFLARLNAKRQFAQYRRKTGPADGNAIFAYVAQNVTPLLPPIRPEKEYDVAVSYLAPHDIVLDKVRAKEKVCWVHTDYSKVDVNVEMERPVWSAYDRIVAVSDAVAQAFVTRFPDLEDRIVTRANILPERLVWERARAFDAGPEMPSEAGVVRLLSVGRFTEAKNFDNVPDICCRILQAGVSVRWYLIGYGADEALIRQKIKDAGMDGRVILLGKKANPYPYFLACDWYVQPSRYEGSPVTIQEARFLGKPVIATAFPTVHSVIRDGSDGFIVPMDNEGCAEGIATFLKKR